MNASIYDQYPGNWDEYVGQDKAKRELRNMATSATKRGKNLPHILISCSTPGVGKTALGLLTIRQANRPMFMAGGKMNIGEVQMMFSKVREGDIIFYDEIHKAADGGARNAEWMLQYLEQGILVTPGGQYRVPQVTFIGATTHVGLLPEAVQERFNIIELADYTNAEGAKIAVALGDKVLMPEGLANLSEVAAAAVALATNNRPRAMRKLLESLRDSAICGEIEAPQNGDYDLSVTLDFADLTWDGLTKTAQEYLRIMYVEMNGNPAGAGVMKERIGLVGNGLALVEDLLKDKGLLRATGRGRALTGDGFARAAELCGDSVAGSVFLS
jgi:Holliday junction DNA helicase RuvB